MIKYAQHIIADHFALAAGATQAQNGGYNFSLKQIKMKIYYIFLITFITNFVY